MKCQQLRKSELPRLTGLLMILTIFLGTNSAMGQTTATWNGNGDGSSFNDAANWDIGQVPINNGGDTFIVVIGGSSSVDFDVPGTGHQVFQLSLAAGSTLDIQSGRDLAVIDQAEIGGLVTASNGDFDGVSAASSFVGSQPRLLADGGGGITHGGATFTNTTHTGDVIRADGVGSSVNLPNLQSMNFDHDFGGSPISTIAARESGLLDLSGLTTVVGYGGGDSLRFEVQSGGTLDLSGLQSIAGFRNVRFTSDGTALNLPALQTIEGAVVFELATGQALSLPALTSYNGSGSNFNANLNPATNGTITANALTDLDDVDIAIGDGGTLNVTSLQSFTRGLLVLGANQTFNAGPLTNLDGSGIQLSGGRTLAVSTTSYNDLDFRAGDVFTASGNGTELDLSAINSMDFDHDFSGSPISTIAARDSGLLDLSGLTTVVGIAAAIRCGSKYKAAAHSICRVCSPLPAFATCGLPPTGPP